MYNVIAITPLIMIPVIEPPFTVTEDYTESCMVGP